MSFVNRRLYKQKPKAWGPVSSVQASIFKNAEKIGIDHTTMCMGCPLWSPGIQYNYINCVGSSGQVNVSYVNGRMFFNSGSIYFISGFPNTHAFTIIVGFERTGTSPAYTVGWGEASNYAGPHVGFSGTKDRVAVWGDGSLETTTLAKGIKTVTKKSPSSGMGKVYNNGILTGSVTLDTRNLIQPYGYIGALPSGASKWLGYIDFVYGFTTELPSTEVAYLSDNPYSILQRVPPVFYSVPGGTPPTFNPLFLNAAQPTRVIQ